MSIKSMRKSMKSNGSMRTMISMKRYGSKRLVNKTDRVDEIVSREVDRIDEVNLFYDTT